MLESFQTFTFAIMPILPFMVQAPLWLVSPFIILLILLATGPVFFPGLWHRSYKAICIVFGLLVASYYVIVGHNFELPLEVFAEYISFISLLVILYIASGGIFLFIDFESKVYTNIIFLFLAALATNFIGTTGASVLFIRPFMRVNRYRLKPYHIIFFIFLVSNVGGSLTPIGDPPLFMGFLKGVPFFWTLAHLWMPWLVTVILLLVLFYFIDIRNQQLDDVDESKHYTQKIIVDGKRNFIWLFIGVASVFIDPNMWDGVPYIELHGKKISFIRELIQLGSALLCYRFASKKALQANHFNFEPIREVAYLFFGIFLCMMPALELLADYAQEHASSMQLSPASVYFVSGFFSAFLDNAPTYLNVFTLLLSSAGLDINQSADVTTFLQSSTASQLIALSAGAVFFGAMTYIGNGPNLMVKSMAEQMGVKMPGFGAYILKYSVPFLLPVLILVCLLFFI